MSRVLSAPYGRLFNIDKIKIGLVLGTVAGAIDITPMILMKLSWDANLSAFSTWVVIGFLISTSNLKMNSILKGLLLSLAVIFPIAILIGAHNVMDLIPVAIMTLVLGSSLGYFVGRVGENRNSKI